MASARNLCQHSDFDGTQCTSNDYISCPHCQLQLCLKHLNSHQDLLRSDVYILYENINRVRSNLDELIFDSTNQRENLFERLDHWYNEQIQSINRIYMEKHQQLEIFCLQAQREFQSCKSRKEKQLTENLSRQLKRVLKDKQIHIDDFNEMKWKLDDIERGLDQLKQLLIDIHYDEEKKNIQLIRRRYVEATKTSIIDDDDNLWDTDNDDENLHDSSSEMIFLSPCSTSIAKKAPLKFIIKRLQQPATSSKVKYKFHTIPTSASLLA